MRLRTCACPCARTCVCVCVRACRRRSTVHVCMTAAAAAMAGAAAVTGAAERAGGARTPGATGSCAGAGAQRLGAPAPRWVLGFRFSHPEPGTLNLHTGATGCPCSTHPCISLPADWFLTTVTKGCSGDAQRGLQFTEGLGSSGGQVFGHPLSGIAQGISEFIRDLDPQRPGDTWPHLSVVKRGLPFARD